MSYDIRLFDKVTNETLTMTTPQFVLGCTMRAEINTETGKLIPAKQIETDINITYNYSNYYYEVFENGIRELYGKTAKDSLEILNELIDKITKKYTTKDGEWIISKRVKNEMYDKDGNIIKDPIRAIINDSQYTSKEIEYSISEGDESNYWEATAVNAIKPLRMMFHMAVEHIGNKNAVWEGD